MKLVTRSEWGARPPVDTDPLPKIDAIVFHYSAMDADERASHSECAARVRGIQRYHIDTKGWDDLAYNWLSCKHGYVFEGRTFNRSGATGDDNSHTVAVCFLGDDTANRDDLTDAGRQALVDAAKLIQARLGKLAYKGHRDFMGTACPGGEIYWFVRSRKFSDLVNGTEEEMTKDEVQALEDAAKKYVSSGQGPGPLPEHKRIVFWALVRAHKASADSELEALRAKIAAARAALA